MKRRIAFIFFLLCLAFSSIGQNGPVITKTYDALAWKDFVVRIEHDFGLHFFFHTDSIPNIIIQVKDNSRKLSEVLIANFKPYEIYIALDGAGNVFLSKSQKIRTQLPKDFFTANQQAEPETDTVEGVSRPANPFLKTNNSYVSRTLIVGNRKAGRLNARARIVGKVISMNDSLPIVGATIYVEDLKKGTATDASGEFNLNIPKGKYTMDVRSVGFEEIKFKIEVLSGGHLDLYLPEKVFLIDELEISSEAYHNVRGTQMGFEKLSINDIKEIPVVLGERDIIKVALLLPGVQQVGEGTSGFNVRGSPADQNLFYIGNIPVYNTSHLFGFFSAFNPDVINDFTLYKSNIPAKYGGRLSSIFDIGVRQGNKKKFSARGGISPITARLLIEGPAMKNKLNYMLGFRSTYSDWVLNFVKDPDIKNSTANFGDAIINLSYQLNASNQIKLLSYYSNDDISLASRVDNNYQNAGTSFSWYHTFSADHDLNFSFSYGNYRFGEDNLEYMPAAYSLDYQLQHYQINFDFSNSTLASHKITYGINTVLYDIDNGNQLPYNDFSLIKALDLGREKGTELAAYVGDEWSLHPKLKVYGGIRYNYYAYLGPNSVFSYREHQPKIPGNITDTLHFSNNEIIKHYEDFDFRLAATYLLNDDLSVKLSYNSLHQYIFMLSNTIALSPTDKWQLVNNNIKPLSGNQISLGLYSNIKHPELELSIEGYLKKVKNLVEYKDGANVVINVHPEQDVLQGKLDSYGIEMMVKKPFGRLNGWVNYTYSNSMVEVSKTLTGESNNFGLPYPANYDKPHSFNFVANYKVNKRLGFSGNVVYSTGRPITYPTAIYYQNGQRILNYSLRNEYRIPDYFRIDLSLKWEGNLKRKKLMHGSWIFSVYNLTGRKNAYSVYFKSEQGKINGYKLSIFGVPIFSITYDFKLGNYNE